MMWWETRDGALAGHEQAVARAQDEYVKRGRLGDGPAGRVSMGSP